MTSPRGRKSHSPSWELVREAHAKEDGKSADGDLPESKTCRTAAPTRKTRKARIPFGNNLGKIIMRSMARALTEIPKPAQCLTDQPKNNLLIFLASMNVKIQST